MVAAVSPSIDYAAYFAAQGAAIERQWRKAEFHPRVFPAIAEEAAATITGIDLDDLLLQESTRLDKTYRFSDFDLHVFVGDRFRIEMLYWATGPTSIHQHAFCGAFKLMAGRSMHVEYDFQQKKEVLPELLIGDMRVRSSEVLETGAVRRIEGGPAFIHANYHMVRPTVTMVIRTTHDGRFGPQFSYNYPHLATHPFAAKDRQTRQSRLVEFIARTGNMDLLTRAIEHEWPDPTLEETLDILRLPIVMNNAERLERELTKARERHPDVAAEIEASIHECVRLEAGETLRKRLVKSEQKFLISLLINLHDAPSILGHLAKEFPNESPSAAAARLLIAIGDTGHLPKVPESSAPDLARLIDARLRPEDASPELTNLSNERLLRPLFRRA